MNEDEIFKSLSHQIRRDIIKFLGEKELTFTEVKKCLEAIDSPTLSYHLKNLQPLLTQQNNKYKLSEIGEAAYNLLSKTDQSVRIARYKKKFSYAYIATVICWITATTLIQFSLRWNLGVVLTSIWIEVILTIISSINYVIIWTLRKRS
jgi:DNA-binding transcriptional ArsR family regulator